MKDQKVLVMGTGISGIAAAELLLDQGAQVTLYDGNAKLDTAALYEKAPGMRDVPLILGELTEEQTKGFSIAVLSPGVPTDIPEVNRMRESGIAIWGEIELAYHFARGSVIAISSSLFSGRMYSSGMPISRR